APTPAGVFASIDEGSAPIAIGARLHMAIDARFPASPRWRRRTRRAMLGPARSRRACHARFLVHRLAADPPVSVSHPRVLADAGSGWRRPVPAAAWRLLSLRPYSVLRDALPVLLLPPRPALPRAGATLLRRAPRRNRALPRRRASIQRRLLRRRHADDGAARARANDRPRAPALRCPRRLRRDQSEGPAPGGARPAAAGRRHPAFRRGAELRRRAAARHGALGKI